MHHRSVRTLHRYVFTNEITLLSGLELKVNQKPIIAFRATVAKRGYGGNHDYGSSGLNPGKNVKQVNLFYIKTCFS